MFAYRPAPTSQPLINVREYDGLKNTDGLVDLRQRFAAVAIPFFDRIVGVRDILALFLAFHLFHLGLATKDNASGTAADDCAVSSWLMICIFATLMVIIVVSNTIRALNPFTLWAEVALGLLYVGIAIVVAGGTGPHRWACVAHTPFPPTQPAPTARPATPRPLHLYPHRLQQNELDVCSAAASPAAQSAYCTRPPKSTPPPCVHAQISPRT